jgi:predicted DNA-binding protein (MmcQ/YjbR family)
MVVALKQYCLSFPGVQETLIGEHSFYYKIADKTFAILDDVELEAKLTVKVDVAEAELLRATDERIMPGYHINKEHWNTVYINYFSGEQLIGWVAGAYNLVHQGLTRRQQARLAESIHLI